ncbi:MAG: TolC family protein [Bacteroidales bacterium]|nr:TolC family protein [Bacteroidales bacterium]
MISRRIYLLALLIFLFTGIIRGQQDTVSLRQCLKSARENAIANQQLEVLQDLADLKTANIKASNLPSLNAYGKASYQSDAISISLPNGFGIEIDPFQYNAGIEAAQKVYDGGLAAKAKELETAILTAETEKIHTDVYKLTTQVADLYFKIQLLDKTKAVLRLKEEILAKRLVELKIVLENGMIKGNDLNAMEAEILTVQQQQIELDKMRRQLLSSLSILTGLNLDKNTILFLEDSLFNFANNQRPETVYFEAEKQKLESLAGLKKTMNYPKLFAFGQAGYSYPSLNFYENQSDFYYIVGAKLSWTIFDWNQNKREIEIIRTQKETLSVKEAEFNQQIDMASQSERINQEELAKLIGLDHQIIRQREAVTRGSEVSLEEGTITSTDYLEDLNGEVGARMQAEYHKIELQRSLVQQKILEGIDLFAL